MNVNAMYKGERVIAAQQEVDDMTVHLKRLLCVSKTVDTSRPYAWDLPHLRTRPKKKQLESDRQREIGIENTQLMRRLARAMKQDAYDPAKASKYRDMAQASCEASRRKARHALSAQNAKLARALVSQKPFYSTDAMREEESARQAVLTSMSRAQRRRKNVRAIDGLCRSQVQLLGLEPGKASSAVERHPQQLPLDYGESLTRELEGGILFSGGGGVQADFKLRTARQMREEVAKAQSRSQSGGASGGSQQGSSAVRRHSTGGGTGGSTGGSTRNSRRAGMPGPCVMHISHVAGESARGNLVLCHTLRDPCRGIDGGVEGGGGSSSAVSQVAGGASVAARSTATA